NVFIGLKIAAHTSAILEYFTDEALELADVSKCTQRCPLQAYCISIAIRGDKVIDTLVHAIIAGGDVLPFLHNRLIFSVVDKPEG
ncbi:hypothetical protein EI94DRAFT_1537326, partial [Lactarius quietus]